MMEKNADKVSLLVDGELDACDMPCVIQALKSDETARTRWENYHLIRDAVSGSLPRQIPAGLARRVAEALEHEPVFINPRSTHTPSPAVSFTTPSRAKATLGFALAASLSAIAVFGVGVMELNPATPLSEPTGMAAVQPPIQMPAQMQVAMAQSAATPSISTVQLASASETAKAKQPLPTVMAAAEGRAESRPARRSGVAVDNDAPVTTDLYDYLVNYHRYAPGAADTQAMLSYVQLVDYGSGH